MDQVAAEQIIAKVDRVIEFGRALQDAQGGAERIATILAMTNYARRAKASLSELVAEDMVVDRVRELLEQIETNGRLIVDGFPDVASPEQWVGPMGEAAGDLLIVRIQLAEIYGLS